MGSNDATYNGTTPHKPKHHYTTSPPTSHSTDRQSVQSYSLGTYRHGPSSTPMASTASSRDIEAAHAQRVARETQAILSRYYK
ncbi:Uu.00g114230.m01.CDS01 [Anthostomella pinea]|uniref:Uu.00g114230.m01.CDS01 n=1 Tax=Anthostomella pinea TaxID=933095 RepID=A0AAI8VGP3_9PEZI|nr:Uu.00g114230.m01.CDS01 [Anthostomella pinea]